MNKDKKFWDLINQNYIELEGERVYLDKKYCEKDSDLFIEYDEKRVCLTKKEIDKYKEKYKGEYKEEIEKILIGKKRMGFTPETTDSFNENTIPWYDIGDLTRSKSLFINKNKTKKQTTNDLILQKISKQSEKYKNPIKKGDVLISFLLTIGEVRIYNCEDIAYCNQAIDIYTLKENIYNKYFALIIGNEYKKVGQKQLLGTNLNDDEKSKIKIKIPKEIVIKNKKISSLKIQKKIADLNLKKNELIERKKSIINNMKFILENEINYLSDNFFKNLIINGWRNYRRKDFVETKLILEYNKNNCRDYFHFFDCGVAVPESHSTEKNLNWISGGVLDSYNIYLENPDKLFKDKEEVFSYIKESDKKKIKNNSDLLKKEESNKKIRSKKMVNNGDILISFRQSIKCNILKNNNKKDIFCNQAVDIFRVNEEKLNKLFFWIQLKNQYLKNSIGEGQNLKLNIPEKEKCIFYIPKVNSLAIQKEIADYLIKEYKNKLSRIDYLNNMFFLLDNIKGAI